MHVCFTLIDILFEQTVLWPLKKELVVTMHTACEMIGICKQFLCLCILLSYCISKDKLRVIEPFCWLVRLDRYIPNGLCTWQKILLQLYETMRMQSDSVFTRSEMLRILYMRTHSKYMENIQTDDIINIHTATFICAQHRSTLNWRHSLLCFSMFVHFYLHSSLHSKRVYSHDPIDLLIV